MLNVSRQKSLRKATIVHYESGLISCGDHARKPSIRFAGFPARTLLESGGLPIEEIAELALREGQSISPLFRVHRWFARRLSSQFRSILVALALDPSESSSFWDTYFGQIDLEGAVVLDPFVGGGTSLIEASRCGAQVIGYDIDPVATFITSFELAASSYEEIPQTARDICQPIQKRVHSFHKTRLSDGSERDVLHHFWVEVRPCDRCGRDFEIHPHFRLAYNKEKRLQWAFCKSCHNVFELAITRRTVKCDCGVRTKINEGSLSAKKIFCSYCGQVQKQSSESTPPRYKLFAQEYIEQHEKGIVRKFKRATEADLALYRRASGALSSFEKRFGQLAPERPIPVKGRSDRRPLIHGFTHYHQLFNDRQRLHLSLLVQTIKTVSDEKVRRLLALAFSEHLATNCMYTAYAFGYRRTSPLFSIHSYRHISRPVEINPWLDNIGRGTFLNALNKIEKAIAFAKAPADPDLAGGRRPSNQSVGRQISSVGTTPQSLFAGDYSAVIKTSSSAELKEIPDGAVDLILTDPPYFDNLSYSELSDFYLAWHQVLGVATGPYKNALRSAPIQKSLVVRSKDESAIEVYCKELSEIFAECKRVLRPDGICVFTYHHRSADAWLSLGYALANSGLRCTSVVPMRGEGQGGLHSYEGTLKWDAVLVCRHAKIKQVSRADSIIVPERAIKRAEIVAARFNARLTAIKRLGFKPADHLNLHRALIAAASRPGLPKRGVRLLSEALPSERG